MLCELPAGTNWNFDLQWSARVPGLLSASSFDGKVSFYNIESASRASIAGSDFGAALSNQTPLGERRGRGGEGMGGRNGGGGARLGRCTASSRAIASYPLI